MVNCRIESCELNDIGTTSIWGDAIRVSSRSYNTRILTNTGRGGILLDNDCTNVVIRGNTISGSGKASGAPGLGIELWTGCNYGLVEFNTLDHWLSLDRSSNTAVRGNTVTDLSGVVKYAGLELAKQPYRLRIPMTPRAPTR